MSFCDGLQATDGTQVFRHLLSINYYVHTCEAVTRHLLPRPDVRNITLDVLVELYFDTSRRLAKLGNYSPGGGRVLTLK